MILRHFGSSQFCVVENNYSVSKLPHHRENIDPECDFPQEMFSIL